MGPSGAGKTTLLQALAGFFPSEGSIRLGDRDLHPLPPERRRIALVFQRASLFPRLRAWENVAFGLRMQGVSRGEQRRRAEEWLERVEIRELSDRLPHQLSEGQAQRVALARALAPGFPVLLLDEPFSALDPPVRRALREVLGRLVRESSIAALFVTHHPEDALGLCENISFLENGRIRWSGPAARAREVSELEHYL
jgi:ABC-type sulfate/molybdate transport systems ATPase subunit